MQEFIGGPFSLYWAPAPIICVQLYWWHVKMTIIHQELVATPSSALSAEEIESPRPAAHW